MVKLSDKFPPKLTPNSGYVGLPHIHEISLLLANSRCLVSSQMWKSESVSSVQGLSVTILRGSRHPHCPGLRDPYLYQSGVGAGRDCLQESKHPLWVTDRLRWGRKTSKIFREFQNLSDALHQQ